MRTISSPLFFIHILLFCICSSAIAQPISKPIRLIVPYAAGGPIDVTARILAERVKDSLGTVIVENRPGAGGNIGADFIAKAAPDGLTIGVAATATHAVNARAYLQCTSHTTAATLRSWRYCLGKLILILTT